jgi:hypothetical protein
MAAKPKKVAADTKPNVSKKSTYTPERLAGLKPVQPGQVLNPNGRPKGSRNKLGEDFLSALQKDFEEHGSATIKTVREERPHEYLKVVASILPKELNVNTRVVEEMSDDELAAGIAALQSVLAAQAIDERGGPETKH